LIINGIFLIILMVMMYFFSKFYTDAIFGSLQGNPTMIDNYMNNNMGLFFLLMFVFVIVALLAGVISFSFVPLYLKLYAERDGQNFGTSELVNAYKLNLGKIFIFLICGFLLAIPLFVVMGIGMFILV